ncbi:MAG: mucoidy inhibitor MuiA family protein [Candidatus Promineifilaceae bacterium]
MEISLETTIKSVTVYPDRARVTAVGETPLSPGEHLLLVNGLPLVMDANSVRAAGSGTAAVRLQGVDVGRVFYEQTPAVRVQALETEIEKLEDELRVLADSKAGWAAHAKYLDGLRQATEQYAWGLSRGRTKVDDQVQLAQFLQQQDDEMRAALRDLDQQQRALSRRLDKLRYELKQLQSARPTQRYQAKVEVLAKTEGTFMLELSYVVNNAGWQPLYDLRLQENGNNGRSLELTYIAQVTQNTGQNWAGVTLAVSTARPALNQRLPELHPWYLNVFTPPQPLPRQMARAGTSAPMVAKSVAFDEAEPMAAMAESVAAEQAVATVQDSGTAVSFLVPGQPNIPSDGSPHKTTINVFKLDPQLDYLSIPKHTAAVFRRVKVRNDSPSPLLPGQANMFFGDEFIGSTHLDYSPVGEEMELLLGVEERIKVERELTRRDVDKALLRDVRQLRYGYKIEMENLTGTEAEVEVHDRIPVGRHEDIKVKLERISPNPAEHSDLNLMEWHLTLAPGAKQTIEYDFQVQHPRTMQVMGLVE